MDEKDEIILTTFLRNSRTPITKIAGELGMTETAVRKRVNKLERIGAIKAYTAIIDPYFAGFESVALVGVDARSEKLLSVLEKITDIDEVRYAALTSGDHMLMFEVWCKTPGQLNSIIERVVKMNGVTKVCPAIFLKRVE